MEDDIQIHARPSAVSRFFTRMRQGFYIITDALGVNHLNNLFVCFRTPKIDPGMELDNVNSALGSIVDIGNRSSSSTRLNQPCQMADLADEDLAAIFQRLPPYARLLVSEVCRRWCVISRMAWLDTEYLDLNSIPCDCVKAIVTQCPNLRSIYASHKAFGKNMLLTRRDFLPEASALSFVRLYDCKVAVWAGGCRAHRCYSGEAAPLKPPSCSNSFAIRDAPSLQELVLDRIEIVCSSTSPIVPASRMSFLSLPTSLKRLQLSGMCQERGEQIFRLDVHRQPHLECLVLHGLQNVSPINEISQLVALREVCLGPVNYSFDLDLLASNLPLLQVLFLSDIGVSMTLQLSDFFTKPSLRILVLSGAFNHGGVPLDVPARKRFPNGLGGLELPLLSVFVGKEASEQIYFAHSSAATFYPISEPMPLYLERAEIAPIFDGVWIAAQIKETARNGGQLWNHGAHDRAVNINLQYHHQ